MIMTFTKLLAIKMVARVRSESSRNILICWSVVVLESSSSSTSAGERLKKAISEPLAKADKRSNMAAKAAAMIQPVEGGRIVKSPKASVMVDISNFYESLSLDSISMLSTYISVT